MPTPFDRMDKGLAAAVGRLLNQPVVWQPQRKRPTGNVYTNDRDEPDPTRERRELEAVVTWRPDIIDAGDVRDQATVLGFSCLVDFELSSFEREGDPGQFDLPRKGDHFELTEEYAGNRIVQVQRPGDDGSQRVIFYCTVPE